MRLIRWTALTLCLMFAALPAFAGATDDQAIPYWEADSPTMASIVEFVAAATGQGDKAG